MKKKKTKPKNQPYIKHHIELRNRRWNSSDFTFIIKGETKIGDISSENMKLRGKSLTSSIYICKDALYFPYLTLLECCFSCFQNFSDF